MSIHTKDVFDYLDTHPVSLYEGDFPSLLEMLHYIYTTCNPIDSEAIRQNFGKLRSAIEHLSVQDQEELFSAACDLCYEYQQLAFAQGLTAGMHLMTEVNALP